MTLWTWDHTGVIAGVVTAALGLPSAWLGMRGAKRGRRDAATRAKADTDRLIGSIDALRAEAIESDQVQQQTITALLREVRRHHQDLMHIHERLDAAGVGGARRYSVHTKL